MRDAPPLQDHQPDLAGDTSVKVTHLVLALLFLGTAGTWALVAAGAITAERLTVLLPSLLIAAGVIGLAATAASSRNRRRGRAGTTPPARQHAGTDDTDGSDDAEPTQVLR